MTENRRQLPMHRVVIAQVRLLRSPRYAYALIGVVLLGVLAFRSAQPEILNDRPVWAQAPRLPSIMPFIVLIGCAAALLTWVSESRSNRRYHHSMPVTHTAHDAARILAGLVWLVVALAVFCVTGALTENAALFNEWLRDALELWIAFFAIPILIYLLCSIFTIAFDLPFAWIAGIVAFALILDTNTVRKEVPQVTAVTAPVFNPQARFTLAQAVGGWDDAWRIAQVSGRWSHWFYWRRGQEAREWAEALLVWYAIAIAGLALVLRRKPVG